MRQDRDTGRISYSIPSKVTRCAAPFIALPLPTNQANQPASQLNVAHYNLRHPDPLVHFFSTLVGSPEPPRDVSLPVFTFAVVHIRCWYDSQRLSPKLPIPRLHSSPSPALV